MRLNEFIQYLTEYKRDITQQKLGDKLLNAAKENNENVDIQQILATLEQIDPTKHKQYVEWLCKQYINKLFRLEDASRVNSALTNFDKIKHKLEVQKRDINKYTLHSLEEAMDEIFNPEVKANNDFNVSGSDVEVKYKGPLGTLAIPLTQEASCRLGSGTKWCTAADKDNKFNHFNSKETPLYIWKDSTGKYQFYFGNDMQFKDARDRDISPVLLNKFKTENPVLSNLFKEKEAEIMKNARLAKLYAVQVLERRWPEAEPYIMKDARVAVWYAVDVIKNRWPEAEPYMMKDASAAQWYAKDVLERRWPEAEPYIMKSPREASQYARYVLERRWPEAEPYIMKDASAAFGYARDLFEREWPEAEPIIAKDANAALWYANEVLKDPDPETWAARYKKAHNLRLNEFIQYLAEYKRDITQQKLGDRLLNAAKSNNEKVDIQQILATLEQIDPTKHKQYVEWLCKQYINKLFRLEDASRINSALTNFDKIKNKLEVQKRDINKYTLHSLEEAMDEIFNPKVKANNDFNVSSSDVEVKYNGPLGTLAIPLTKEASCRLGSGTKWCTAANENNRFDYYNKDAPLYIWKDSTGKYQFYFGNDMQFKDAGDRDISPDILNKFRTKHPVLSNLFKEKEAEMMKNPYTAVSYAKTFMPNGWPEAEPIIMKDAYSAYEYAHNVLKDRWPEAEPIIMRGPLAATLYAANILKHRLPEAEPIIMKDPSSATIYAKHFMPNGWPEAEPYIMKDATEAYRYAYGVLERRWPEAEPIIMKDASTARYYASFILQRRWPEAEPYIKRDPRAAALYASQVLKGRWPEAEPYIMKDAYTADWYASEVLKDTNPETWAERYNKEHNKENDGTGIRIANLTEKTLQEKAMRYTYRKLTANMKNSFNFNYFISEVGRSNADYSKSAVIVDNGNVVASLIMGDVNMYNLDNVDLKGVQGIAMASDSPRLFPKLARYALNMWDCDYFWGGSIKQIGAADFWKKHAIIMSDDGDVITFVLPISNKAKKFFKDKKAK